MVYWENLWKQFYYTVTWSNSEQILTALKMSGISQSSRIVWITFIKTPGQVKSLFFLFLLHVQFIFLRSKPVF